MADAVLPAEAEHHAVPAGHVADQLREGGLVTPILVKFLRQLLRELHPLLLDKQEALLHDYLLYLDPPGVGVRLDDGQGSLQPRPRHPCLCPPQNFRRAQ